MKAEGLGSTFRLAQYLAGLRFEDIPAPVIERARCVLLDGLSCLVLGTRGTVGRDAIKVVKLLGGNPHCTIFGGDFRSSVRNAAYANAMTLYSVGLNDIHKPSTSHPAGCIVMPTLAVGEWLDRGGANVLAALVAGYEMNARVGTAMAPSHRERGFHTTGTVGAFGATAAVGNLMGLSPDLLANAFGVTGSQAAGLYEFHHDGSLTMVYHAGRAAQNGVEACILVEHGLTGPVTVLEGSKGFFRAASDSYDLDILTRDLGERHLIEETSFRLYYGCNSTLAASAATERLLNDRGIRPEDIRKIVVRCHPVVARDNNDATAGTLLAARLSMQFNLALVLARGHVWTADIYDDDLHDASIRALMPRISLVADDTMPRFGASVIAEMADGAQVEETVRSPVGDAGTPPSFEEIATKFRRMASPVGGEAAAERLVSIVADLERESCRTLVQALSHACGREDLS